MNRGGWRGVERDREDGMCVVEVNGVREQPLASLWKQSGNGSHRAGQGKVRQFEARRGEAGQGKVSGIIHTMHKDRTGQTVRQGPACTVAVGSTVVK